MRVSFNDFHIKTLSYGITIFYAGGGDGRSKALICSKAGIFGRHGVGGDLGL